jgi:DNA-binding MarR family transcriptional regulator
MKLKLTPRQQTFLDKLFELYRERNGPVHYSVVAERLGVNKFSAYDMLKLLEEKGVAASEYVLGQRSAGPGRSMIVFYPTSKAASFLSQLRNERRIGDEWQAVKESILKRLNESRESGAAESLNEIINRLPDVGSPLAYCAEVISALLLNLNEIWSRHAPGVTSGPAVQSPWPTLRVLGTKGEIGLSTLAGFSLGSIFPENRVDPSQIDALVAHTKRFQNYLHELSEERISMLSGFLQEALAVFDKSSGTTAKKAADK